ncbi:hypothetical protein CRG98_009456 [Punica granatum]|uniref:Protein ENDOSPERM DEFECTIVE 1-like n=1 Tax=Punica granatum TaxID=22663 RepID=A0A2I0KNR3_PUNGR|nr:hypothetical protein CRG98_009456 [Punica granatum]
MSGSTVENDATAQHPPEAAAAAAPLPPPPTQRRPRVREVRSRFMSPVVSSSSSGDLHLPTTKSPVPKHGTDTQPRQNQQHGRSTSAQRRRQLELEPLSRADENRPETTRSLDTPLAGPAKPTTGTSVHKRQPLPRSVKENGDPEAIPRISSRNLRPDTPTLPTPINVGKVPLPPVPPCAKPGADAKKGRKVSSHQEDVHTLRLLHNHYLQWRFANAKAEVSMQAQRREAERMLYSLSLKIADMYDSVKRKRTELATLRRIKNVSSILESQTPYLEEWSALEDDYLASVSEATQALLNASYQLPVGANVRADVREVKEALASAVKIMEAITIHVQSFTAKAEELEVFISELARVAGGERILVEGCGDLLHRTYFSQVEECSLRGQIIQQQQKAMIQCSE